MRLKDLTVAGAAPSQVMTWRHSGMVNTLEAARERMTWPGQADSVKEMAIIWDRGNTPWGYSVEGDTKRRRRGEAWMCRRWNRRCAEAWSARMVTSSCRHADTPAMHLHLTR
jgi:hypothetical protein